MGLGNFARVHFQAYAADDTVKELVDLNADLKAKLDHEHNKRVREKADAKVAFTDARSQAAIDLACMKADMKVAVAEAESRGRARGEAIGFQRAMDETELFDAGFKGGRRQAQDIPAGKQCKSTSVQQWQVRRLQLHPVAKGLRRSEKGHHRHIVLLTSKALNVSTSHQRIADGRAIQIAHVERTVTDRSA